MGIKLINENGFNQVNLRYTARLDANDKSISLFIYAPGNEQLFTNLTTQTGISKAELTDYPYDQYLVNMKLTPSSNLTDKDQTILLYTKDNNKIRYFMNLKKSVEKNAINARSYS